MIVTKIIVSSKKYYHKEQEPTTFVFFNTHIFNRNKTKDIMLNMLINKIIYSMNYKLGTVNLLSKYS